MTDKQIRICWTSKGATTKGVRRVRVLPQTGRRTPWKNCDKWEHFGDADLFDDRETAIADGERRREERRVSLQKWLDRLQKPMRVVEKIEESA